MRTIQILSVVLLCVALLAATSGCKSKTAPKETGASTRSIADNAGKAVESAAVSIKAAAVDLSKSLDQLKADVAKMDINQLKAGAEACKQAYMEKKANLAAVTERLKAIPLAEKAGAEAQKLAGEVKTIQEAMSKIQAQLGVYVERLAEMKADTSAFKLE
jgi:uncharacterized protein (DUF342 family)